MNELVDSFWRVVWALDRHPVLTKLANRSIEVRDCGANLKCSDTKRFEIKNAMVQNVSSKLFDRLRRVLRTLDRYHRALMTSRLQFGILVEKFNTPVRNVLKIQNTLVPNVLTKHLKKF